MLNGNLYTRQQCPAFPQALSSRSRSPSYFLHKHKTPPQRIPASDKELQARAAFTVFSARVDVASSAKPGPMAAQVDAKSKIPIQEMVDLAVIWASQHGLVRR